MPDVFISHSSHDAIVAEELANRIRQFGLNVFLDSTSIAPGDDWTKVIQQNLNGAPVMLLLATKNGIASPTVNQEAGWAMKQGCKIVPIVWDLLPERLPPWIARYQAIVLTGKTEAEINDQLSNLIKQIVIQKKRPHELATLAIIGLAILAIVSK